VKRWFVGLLAVFGCGSSGGSEAPSLESRRAELAPKLEAQLALLAKAGDAAKAVTAPVAPAATAVGDALGSIANVNVGGTQVLGNSSTPAAVGVGVGTNGKLLDVNVGGLLGKKN